MSQQEVISSGDHKGGGRQREVAHKVSKVQEMIYWYYNLIIITLRCVTSQLRSD